jgi:hypothetical protein
MRHAYVGMGVAQRALMRAWLPFAFLLLPACASERAVLASHLQECGLLTEGDRAAMALRDVYLPTPCYEDCFARASCEALEGALCRTSLELLFACDQACAFRCGDNTIIGTERRCNGVNDCEDARDEEGCTNLVRCADGSMRTGVRCNGRQECWDNSDELGCPGPSCNGSPLPSYLRCNGYNDCADGSDERVCPTYRCDDGTAFPFQSDPRCDGYTHCADASDEVGCARLALMCMAP